MINKIPFDLKSLNPYPMTFGSVYKDYLWGGRNLEKLDKTLPNGTVAESWEISAHHDGMSVVASGKFEGRTLSDLSTEFSAEFLGIRSYKHYRNKFPLLIKFIDANDRLSVQVHPNDEYASLHENDLGKTEMWYVLEAQPDASILYGFNHEMNRNDFEKVLTESKISSVLRSIPVKAGDIIYIPAGTVHAVGKGILIAEIQESSNSTYRLYDYDRKKADGSTRPLHIDRALDCIDFKNSTRKGKFAGLVYEKCGLSIRAAIADPHFFVEIVSVNDKADLLADGSSFITYTFLNGSGFLDWETGSIQVKSGMSVLIPATLGRYSIKGKIEALRAYIGDPESDILLPLTCAGCKKEQIVDAIGGFAL